MHKPRSWIDQELHPGAEIQLPDAIRRHLLQVLRLQSGDECILFNGRDGCEYPARIVLANKQQMVVKILAGSKPEPPPELRIHLILGISRGERMDFAIQKAVELGVDSITPVFSQRSVVKLRDQRLQKKVAHWQGIIISACEQSGRCRLPQLYGPRRLNEWLESTPDADKTLFLDPLAPSSLKEIPPPDGAIHLLVGPEGGFDEQERQLAYASGCEGIHLGPRILRTETAPLAAITAAQILWGDLA